MKVVSKFRRWEIPVTGKNKVENFFQIFLKTVWNFGILSMPVYGDRGSLYRSAAKILVISLKLLRQRAPNFFIWVRLKVHWNFTVDRTGAPLMLFGRGKVYNL